jgi:NAD(P)-dependent dehydrogenase (short-subunit alcohol dehydrogenase family)
MKGFVKIGKSVAIVSGAGSGIGRAAALSLAARGSRVMVTDLLTDRAASVAAEIVESGGSAIAQGCNVSEIAELESVRDRTLEEFGQIDIVMNNVGVIAMGPPETLPLQEWERVIDVNLLSIVRSNLTFLPLLLSQGHGHVVNTASASGLLAYGYDRLPYVATKHAVVGLTESLARYLRPRGIGVTCLCPSGVITNIVEQMTSFGDPITPRAPAYPIVEAEVVGELVADAIADGRFLILTATEVQDELEERTRDIEGYLDRLTAEESQ